MIGNNLISKTYSKKDARGSNIQKEKIELIKQKIIIKTLMQFPN